jgi:Holliday junction resolvase RusA-like endonuclease
LATVIAFRVPGVPAPQGSKNPFGGESNPRTRPWRAAVSAEAALAMEGLEMILEPVHVTALFYFPRPKAHYRTGKNAHLMRDDAPAYKAGHPDLDKLQRAIGDSLTGIVVRDDKQIVAWNTVKLYGNQAGVEITVTQLPREETHAYSDSTTGADSP